MQIVYHIGANCTDQDRLFKSVLKNNDIFAPLGVKVPGPGKYRKLIRGTIQNLDGARLAADAPEILRDAILDDEHCRRLILSDAQFTCADHRVFEGGFFYAGAAEKIVGLSNVFGDDVEIFLGLRNPATFIPAIFGNRPADGFADFMHGVDPMQVRWSDVITRIQHAAPGVKLTVWCNEDTPLIWAQLIRALAGVDPLTRITGGFDLLRTIISADGMTKFIAYLRANPPQTRSEKHRIIAVFMEKFALPDEVEETIDMPGWTQDTIAQLTAAYDRDVEQIEKMEGVRFIAP